MAWNVGRSPVGKKKEEKDSSDGINESEVENAKDNKKKTNSWDSSSSSRSSLSSSTPKHKPSDWDVSSADCHETMVEPFNDKLTKESNDEEDDENDFDQNDHIDNIMSPYGETGKRTKIELYNTLDFSGPEVSVTKRNSLFDIFDAVSGEKSKAYGVTKRNTDERQQKKGEEDSLLVIEDIEEFVRDETRQKTDSESTGQSTEDTANDDTTIWMIPKSDRSSRNTATNSDSKVMSGSESKNLEAEGNETTGKRAKSSSRMPSKRNKVPIKSSRSDCVNDVGSREINLLKDLPIICEGTGSNRKPNVECKSDDKRTGFDQSGVYFTEYECRTITVHSDAPSTSLKSSDSNDEEEEDDDDEDEGEIEEERHQINMENITATEEVPRVEENSGNYDAVLAGPSTQTSLEVVSLPDIIGRSSLKDRQTKEKFSRRLNSPSRTVWPEAEENVQPNLGMKKANESWFLLDETGQYQPVTRDEVTLLLNGRSADAVLQRHKEHFIQSPALQDTSPKGSLGGLLTKESIQNILREEDFGGEGHDWKPIDLERKVENSLLYIQPGINLTASIRIIPVETEMIHIWRRSRDNGSMLSSDVDLRLQSSQDSVETTNQKNVCDHHGVYLPRIIIEKQQQTVTEQDENTALELSTATPHVESDNDYNKSQGTDSGNNIYDNKENDDNDDNDDDDNNNDNISNNFSNNNNNDNNSIGNNGDTENNKTDNKLENQMPDYSRLLIETRMIVDNLTNSFKILQTRLDGETNRSCALQVEITKLRQLLNDPTEKVNSEHNSKETIVEQNGTNKSSYSSLISEPVSAKENNKGDSTSEVAVAIGDIIGSDIAVENTSEVVPTPAIQSDETIGEMRPSADYITVNIYTTDDHSLQCHASGLQETNSLLQANLGIIEGKMKKLEQENDTITKQNADLKRKLKEISLELEKYLASTMDAEMLVEEDRDVDTLRDQVCNLKLELDNLKKVTRNQEREIKKENSMLRRELQANATSLDEWLATASQVFREVENLISELEENEILIGENFGLIDKDSREPENFLWTLNSFLRRVTERLIAERSENHANETKVRHGGRYATETNEMPGDLDKVKLECLRLMEHLKNGQTIPSERVIDDYFAVIMEKAELAEEIKIVKTENEILQANQTETHEKLREIMISLKDSKNEISALESRQKFSEEEKSQMMSVLKVYEEENARLNNALNEKNTAMEGLLEERKSSQTELESLRNQLNARAEEVKNLEKSYRLKEDLFREANVENDRLLKMDETKKSQIQVLQSEINNLEIQRTQLESEMTSTKQLMNQSQKEMTEYINHLETILNNNQEALDKSKQKLKDTTQAMSRLKTENEALDKQCQSQVKLYNAAKEELHKCNEKLSSLSEKQKQAEDEKDRLLEKFQSLITSEKKSLEALDSVTGELKTLQNENSDLKQRLLGYSKDRDESLKEQKDLINKYAMLSKELQKVQEKYRHVKSECNERANVIRHLEMMLKENMLEYNHKITYLENNITHILDKIAACKNTMSEKYDGIDAEAVKLRQQLYITHQERQELENVIGNYYTAIKHLESEIQNREKEVSELNEKLSLEQKKWTEYNKSEERMEAKEELKMKSGHLKIQELQNEITMAENALTECKKQLKQSEVNHENEKKKLELNIADLKSELSRYQMRMEVMMRNLSNCNKNLNHQSNENKHLEDMTRKVQIMKDEIRAKDRKLAELNDLIARFKEESAAKTSELENLRKKNVSILEIIKNLENHVRKVEDALSLTNEESDRLQKDKNEMADKLMQSIKIIMEEKSAKQTIELLAAEKEKSYKEQIDHLKNQLEMKSSVCTSLSKEVEEKKKLAAKLQQDIKKLKSETTVLKTQVTSYKKMNSFYKGIEASTATSPNIQNYPADSLFKAHSLNQVKVSNFSPERLDSCLRELKEIRDVNLLLRKTEGEYQAKIVKLEDELRDARLTIKELEGSIKIEKKSKKALKNMIASAKIEIDKCLIGKQIISCVADRIGRHLDLDESHSKAYGMPHRTNSSESYN